MWYHECTFPIVVQSIHFGGLRIAYGVYENDEVRLYGCYRDPYCKDDVGLASNFIPLTKKKDLAEKYKIIQNNLQKV